MKPETDYTTTTIADVSIDTVSLAVICSSNAIGSVFVYNVYLSEYEIQIHPNRTII
jgi:hypothetical protein